MHSLLWDGRITRDNEAPWLIQIFTDIYNYYVDIRKNEIVSSFKSLNDYFSWSN